MKIFTISCLLLLSLLSYSNQWKFEKEKNGISIYTRLQDGSKIKDSRAVTTTDRSINEVLNILKDVSNYVEWTPDCLFVKILDQSEDSITYHAAYNVPVVSDRDMVLQLVVQEHTDKSVIVRILNKDGVLDPVKGFVRIPKYEGEYKLTLLDNQRVEIDMWYSTDPGGSVPSWLANTSSVDSPYKTISGLLKMLQKRKLEP